MSAPVPALVVMGVSGCGKSELGRGVAGHYGAAFIEVASCYGCGACAAECPGKAITLLHFTDAQILAKEKAAFN